MHGGDKDDETVHTLGIEVKKRGGFDQVKIHKLTIEGPIPSYGNHFLHD